MKKVFSLLITLAMLISTIAIPVSASAEVSVWDGTTVDTVWAGSGTEADPYLISSAAELAGLSEKVWESINNVTGVSDESIPMNAPTDATEGALSHYNVYNNTYFKLTSDIDLDNKEWKPIGREGARFNGIIDGNAHVVKNVKVTLLYTGVGFFGATGRNTVVTNLGLENVDMKVAAGTYANGAGLQDYKEFGVSGHLQYLWGMGAMVGLVGGGAFTDCYVKNVKLENSTVGCGEAGVGGFFGNFRAIEQHAALTAKNCYVMNVDISADDAACGFLSNTDGEGLKNVKTRTFENCYVGGDVSLKSNGSSGTEITGFIRKIGNGTYTNCYSVADNFIATDALNTTATKETKVTNIANVSSYMNDDPFDPVNCGYPIFTWQTGCDVWDGTADTVWSGEGTESDPYLLTSAEELAGLASAIEALTLETADGGYSKYDPTHKLAYTGKYYKLTTDIDLANLEWVPIGRIGVKFDGKFDGGGHVVKNLKMTKEKSATGLFGAIGENAHIWNVGVDGIDIQTSIGSYNEHTDELYHNTQYGRIDRCYGFGGLVGQICPAANSSDITVKNCYVKNVLIKPTSKQMGCNGMGALVGNVLSVLTTNSANNYNKFYISDCYAEDVELWSHVDSAPIVGGVLASNYTGNSVACYPIIRNCYVKGDVDLYATSNAQPNGIPNSEKCYNFATLRGDATQCAVTNCFTSTNAYNNFSFSNSNENTQYPVYSVDPAVVSAALVTGDDRWSLDCAEIPTNDGYPVLGWERKWTVEDYPRSWYMSAGVSVDEENNLTGVKIVQSDADVPGTVIVAVYSGERFLGCVTATAVSGDVTLPAPIAVESGNTVKVFVWGSTIELNPLAEVYSTTIE